MRSTGWHTSPLPYDTVRRLSQVLGTSEVTASVIARRGYCDADSALRFLDSDGELHDPFLFPQMQAVCDRLIAAISQEEKICIHGDYDVDGITSTALLLSIIQSLGGNVTAHLPNRFTEGYGIATQAIERLAEQETRLLVTVDCGIGAVEQIARAKELGLDAIVIDHHRPPEGDLPDALIISPLVCDYPFKELAGVGLAFKVAQALLEKAMPIESSADIHDIHPEVQKHLDLVALGTIADVVPLVDENRTLVKRGLVQLSRTGKPGLKALMSAGQVEPGRINAGLVAFRMAPRINAAGRLEDPGPSLDLLMAEDEQTANELAARLDGFNRERQRIENQMLAEARKMIGEWPRERQDQRGYVLSSPGWHEGVIGIVASRLVDLYSRPVIIIAEDEDAGLGKGSGRSVGDFDLHSSLVELCDLLKTYGGHRAACGLSIESGRIEDFRQQFADYADSCLSGMELERSRYVDAVVCGRELTLELAQELSRLEPFGLGNPSVELLVTGARISDDRVTRDGQHLQCLVESGGTRAKAIGFGQAFLQDAIRSTPDWDVAFQLERNEFKGSVSPQLQLRELFPRASGPETIMGLCSSGCDFDCPERVRGKAFWSLLTENLDIPGSWQPGTGGAAIETAAESSPLNGRLVDRRGYGSITGQIAKLLSGGENVLLLVADVARRRRLASHELPLSGSQVEKVLLASARCDSLLLENRLKQTGCGGQTVMIADFPTAAAMPEVLEAFEHLVFIDPPWNQMILDSLAAAAPDAYIHLFYCSDEVQFSSKVLEHEYDLRSSLTRVYKQLEAGKTYLLDESVERLLLAGGKHLRQPMMVARCLRILEELGLISVEDEAGAPIMTVLEARHTELDQSPTYRGLQSFYRESLKFLSKSPDVKEI
ncbi:MAG: single-stranded-DNA-specific exonuclease RecJ [Actinobacteria bacterium]|nr:single-stranded-DNA-specific exonuclease RecJ [Actinomycetota bacterium]